MTFHSGKGGAAIFTGPGTNTCELAITKWSVDPKVEIVQFKNSKTGNYAKKEATFHDADFTISYDHDFDNNAFATPILLNEGDVLTTVKLFLYGGTAGTSFWLFPSAIVVGTPQSLDIEGKIESTVNLTADGTFTPPTA